MRGDDVSQLFRHAGIEDGCVQVRAYLAHDEGRPCSIQLSLLQRGSEKLHELSEALDVGEASGHLLRAHFVRDSRDAEPPAFRLGVLQQLYGTIYYYADVERFSAGEGAVHRGVHVEQRVTGLQASGHRALCLVHSLFEVESSLGVGVLQLRAAVIQTRV